MSRTFKTHQWIKTRTELPGRLEIDRVYFIADEGVFVLDHGSGAVEFGNKGGGGTSVEIVDDLATGGADKALSARQGVVLKGLIDAKPDEIDTLYRGVYSDEAALAAAYPTDTTGAYAIVLSTGTLWICDGASWANSGKAPETVPGVTPTDAAGIRIEDVTIPAAGWSMNGTDTTGYPYYMDIADSVLKGDESATVIPARESLAVVTGAGICPTIDILPGKIRVYAANVPSADINGTAVIFSAGGGNVSTASDAQVDDALDNIGL